LFQSSPVTKDGRYGKAWTDETALRRFQSSPVTKDGRYGGPVADEGGTAMFQSSPVTKDGRYRAVEAPAVVDIGFNPRPSLRTGATGHGP